MTVASYLIFKVKLMSNLRKRFNRVPNFPTEFYVISVAGDVDGNTNTLPIEMDQTWYHQTKDEMITALFSKSVDAFDSSKMSVSTNDPFISV